MRCRYKNLKTAGHSKRPGPPAFRRAFSAVHHARRAAGALALSFAILPGIWALTLPFAAFAPAWARTTDGVELSGATAKLFKAVEVNDMPGVKAALAAGADINAKNAAGKTAADLAVDRGHFIIAHFLLSQRSPGVRAPRTAEPKSAPTPRRLTPKPATTSKPAAKSRKTVAQPLSLIHI